MERASLEWLLRHASLVGDAAVLVCLVVCMFAAGALARDSQTQRTSVILASALSMAALVVWVFKLGFNRSPDGVFHGFWAGPRGEMFPSGHTAMAVTTAMVLARAWSRWQWLPWMLAASVAVSRALFFHFVSDVVAGALIGAIVGYYAVELAARTTFLNLRPRCSPVSPPTASSGRGKAGPRG